MARGRIALGVGSAWARHLVSIGVGILYLPILYANFPRDVLGVYLLFFTAASLLNLADLGLGIVLSRAIAYARGAPVDQPQADAAPEAAFYRRARLPDI